MLLLRPSLHYVIRDYVTHDFDEIPQLLRPPKINSFTTTDHTWNSAKAKLLARWKRTVFARKLHRGRRGMLKEAVSSTYTYFQPDLLGSTIATEPQVEKEAVAGTPEARRPKYLSISENESPLKPSTSVRSYAHRNARCLKSSTANREALNSKNQGAVPQVSSVQQAQDQRPADPMESNKQTNAAPRSSHCQRNQRGKSGYTPEQYLALKKQEKVARVMAEFNKWFEKFDRKLTVAAYAYSDTGGDSTTGNAGSTNSGNGQDESSSRRPKRQFDGDDQNNSSAGGDEDGPDRGNNKRAKKTIEQEQKFACPFYKHDPRVHSKHRSCCGPGWPSIHRLKEHLYRIHRLPKHTCPRCAAPFEDANDLNIHLRDDTRCEKLELLPIQGIDEATEAKLRHRKKNGSGMTDEQRWREIYLVLFPTANPKAIPSPYYDGSDALAMRQSAAKWRKVKKQITQELPRIVQRDVERKFDKVEAAVLDGIRDIVREGLREILLPFSQSPVETPAGSPRPPTLSDPASEEPPVGPNEEDKEGFIDLSHLLTDADGSFNGYGFDIYDYGDNFENGTGFDLGDYLECNRFEPGSDSGYVSTSTARDAFV